MIDALTELAIRKHLTEKIGALPSNFAILPAPVIFENRASFFATTQGTQATQKAIETTPVRFCSISLLLPFEDENPITDGCLDAPLTTPTYNFYVFRQYAATRTDETDAFLTRTLESYNEFIEFVYLLRTEFLGTNKIIGIDENLDIETQSLTAGEFIEDFEPSKYFQKENIFGHAISLNLRIDILPLGD